MNGLNSFPSSQTGEPYTWILKFQELRTGVGFDMNLWYNLADSAINMLVGALAVDISIR